MTTLNLSKSTPALNLTKAAPSLTTLKGALSWDMHPIHGKSLSAGFDLDIFVIAANASEKIDSGDDVAFFNNKSVFGGGIQLSADNRTGEGDGVDEEVTFQLGKIPAGKTNLDIYVFLHDSVARSQNFGMMANAFFTLLDAGNGREIQRYSLSQYTTGDVLHVGRLSRASGTWEFQPVGEASVADPNAVLGAYL